MEFRRSTAADLHATIALLADGGAREDASRRRECGVVQLTTDMPTARRRADAHRSLGLEASHEAMKLALTSARHKGTKLVRGSSRATREALTVIGASNRHAPMVSCIRSKKTKLPGLNSSTLP